MKSRYLGNYKTVFHCFFCISYLLSFPKLFFLRSEKRRFVFCCFYFFAILFFCTLSAQRKFTSALLSFTMFNNDLSIYTLALSRSLYFSLLALSRRSLRVSGNGLFHFLSSTFHCLYICMYIRKFTMPHVIMLFLFFFLHFLV